MFRFLHTADWQIGRPFRAFGDRVGAVLEEARLDAIDTLAGAARRHGARDILVAGDVFDAEDLGRRAIQQAIDRMAGQTGLVWHLLPGNHDPARPGGLWERIAGWGLPTNIRTRTTPVASELHPGVWLLPAPLTAKTASADPTAALDRMATPDGCVRIGLAHGSVRSFAGGPVNPGAAGNIDGAGPSSRGFGGEAGGATDFAVSSSAAGMVGKASSDLDTIDPARARLAGLAYLALGDWHGMTRIDARTWYSGTPEPDRYLDNTPGHALVVGIDGAAPPEILPVETQRYVWRQETITIGRLDDLEREGARLIGLAHQPGRLLLRLAVTGMLTLQERAAAEHWRVRLAERLRHLDVDFDGVGVRVGASEADLFAGDDSLAGIAARLTEMAEAAEDIGVRARSRGALLALAGILDDLDREEAA